jgi:hypothetical protein
MREVIEDLARAGAQAPAEEAAIPAQESAEEARQLLATGAGHRCHLGHSDDASSRFWRRRTARSPLYDIKPIWMVRESRGGAECLI